MNEYIYLILKIKKETGEVEIMGNKSASDISLMKEIIDVYHKLDINYKNESKHDDFEKYTKYNYNERSSMTTTTYAEI